MPKVTRRRFIQVTGASVAAMAGLKGLAKAMELEVGGKAYNYARVAVNRNNTAYTVSPFSKLNSPQQVFIENGKVVSSTGFLNHPATRGRSSALDVTAHLAAGDPDRVLSPLKRTGKRGENKWKKISWDEALTEISQKINDSISKGGPGSVWLINRDDSPDGALKRFMHTIGSASIVSTGCDKSKKAAQKLTWGEEMELPDFARSRYILNFGSNIYETFPSHTQAVIDGKTDRHAKLVTFDPRMSMTAGLSYEWIPIAPGTDGLVALAMANVIIREGLHDAAFINSWTNISADRLAKHLSQFTLEMAEKESGVKADVIRRIAVDFATSKPATVFTYRGASSHSNGTYTERAIMLLPVITGNVEIEGGYCLPRRIKWDEIKPAPAAPKQAQNIKDSAFPYAVKSGAAKVGVLINYDANPAYSTPSASYWREIIKDEGLVPFSIGITSLMGETAQFADLVLPDAVYLERNEPVSSPSLFPWVGVRIPVSNVAGEARELKVILRDLVNALDKDGSRNMKKYWDFQDPQDWMTKYFENVPGLKEEGGFGFLKDNGVWPNYGSLDIKTGKVMDKDGKPLRAEYGRQKKGGFGTPSRKIEIYSDALGKMGLEPLPTWQKPANLEAEKEGEKEAFVFITFKTAYRGGLISANNKYLAEKDHYNHCLINKESAKEMGIKDGDLIRVISPVGYLVTKARATQSIHPRVVGMAGGFGHRAGGRVAQMEPHHKPEWAAGTDADVRHNLWWEDNGVNPNDILPYFADPATGNPALSFAAKIEKAKAGDKYGDIKTDISSQEAFYKKALEKVKG